MFRFTIERKKYRDIKEQCDSFWRANLKLIEARDKLAFQLAKAEEEISQLKKQLKSEAKPFVSKVKEPEPTVVFARNYTI